MPIQVRIEKASKDAESAILLPPHLRGATAQEPARHAYVLQLFGIDWGSNINIDCRRS